MIYSYRRVSTDEQHNGPEAQSADISRWIKQSTGHYANVANVDYFDNGVSGSVPLKERPEGGKLYVMASKGDTIVTAKLDRLFRSVADAAVTIQHWIEHGVNLVAVSEGFDMTSPYGRAMAQMASVFAELEREMIRSRTKAALQAKKARGECVGEVPYGWDKDKNGKLISNSVQRSRMRVAKTLRTEGYTYKEIAKRFNDAGWTAKNGGKWHATQVRRILERQG